MYQNNSRWSGQYKDHTRLTQFPNFVSHNVNYSGRSQHPNFNRLTKGTNLQNNKKFQKKNFYDKTQKSKIRINKDIKRESKSMIVPSCVKQVWILEYLMALLKYANDKKRPKQVWVPKSLV